MSIVLVFPVIIKKIIVKDNVRKSISFHLIIFVFVRRNSSLAENFLTMDKKRSADRFTNKTKISRKDDEFNIPMFRQGDRVRIAHHDLYERAEDCDRWAHPICPIEDDNPLSWVGKFGTICLISLADTSTKNVEHKSIGMNPNTKLTVRLDMPENHQSFRCFSIDAIDVINYTLLGDEKGDLLFNEARDRDFGWSFMFKEPQELMNMQMRTNLSKIDAVERKEIETIVDVFKNQTHNFYHKIFSFQNNVNQILRCCTHEVMLIQKKTESDRERNQNMDQKKFFKTK